MEEEEMLVYVRDWVCDNRCCVRMDPSIESG